MHAHPGSESHHAGQAHPARGSWCKYFAYMSTLLLGFCHEQSGGIISPSHQASAGQSRRAT